MCCIARCCIKCCLTLCNTFVILIGLLLCALGGIIMWGWPLISTFIKPVLDGLQSNYGVSSDSISLTALSAVTTLGVVLFIIGCIFVGLGVFGYVAACCSCCKICSIAYIIFLIVILLAELIFVIVYFAANQQLSDQFKSYLVTIIQVSAPFVLT